MTLSPLPTNDEDLAEFSVETREASPANLFMKIKSYSLLSKYEISKYESREFEAGGYKWKIIFYPDGYKSKKEGDHISVCLSTSGTESLPVDWEINALFTFFLYNQINDNYLCFRGMSRRFNAVNSKWRFTNLISKKSLIDPSNGYLVDDNCVFGAEVFVIKTQRINECMSLLKESPPFKHDWKLSSFSKLESVWNSELLKVGDHNWNVKLYPKGDGLAKGRYVSIYLECTESKSFQPHQKVKAKVVMSLRSNLGDTRHSKKFAHWFKLSKPYHGSAEFISIDDMSDPSKGFLVGDCCILEIEISVLAVIDAPKI